MVDKKGRWPEGKKEGAKSPLSGKIRGKREEAGGEENYGDFKRDE